MNRKIKIAVVAGALALGILMTGVPPATASGKCNPNGRCTACKNCTGCKHCAKSGGVCSVCSGNYAPSKRGKHGRKNTAKPPRKNAPKKSK